ncbi:MAG: DUF131 domain-containing protein [Methanotrichaceae archaeon]|nr:DUF131 domain-containing protein [Methanotrichaceae archaeon]MDD1757690.1 DUF131 domain-containing protein [Methanotrichaceae archaeon]
MRYMLGAALMIIGFLMVSVSFLQDDLPNNTSLGGVIFIGPLPIIFGSSPQMAIAAMILALAFMVISILIFRRIV